MKAAVLLITAALLTTAAPAQDRSEPATPDSAGSAALLDPLDPAAGDFLDLSLDSLERTAREAYQAGNYQLAARTYLGILARNVTDDGSIYNLACCYGLMGEPELAARYLVRAFRAGFDDVAHVNRDPDFAPVRGKERFDEVVDSIATAAETREAELGAAFRIAAPALLKYRLHLPATYDSTLACPLLVGLHGLGSSADRFARLWSRFDEPDFIYAIPQAPYPFSVGTDVGYSWYTRVREDPAATTRSRLMTEEYILDVVRDVTERYNVSDVYLLGFSQGCAFTYATAIRNPGPFTGLICFGGWLDTDWLSETDIRAADDLRVLIVHGRQDTGVDYENGTDARDLLKRHGYDVAFVDFDGGHRVPAEHLKLAAEWMQR